MCDHFTKIATQFCYNNQLVEYQQNYKCMQPLNKLNRLKLDKEDLIDRYLGSEFNNLGIIGSGSYGDVYRVQHKQTKKIYAIKLYKRIFDNRILALRTLRELVILRKLKSERIIKIYDIIQPLDIENYTTLAVVLEYLPFDLKRLCEKLFTLKDQHIAKIMYQLLIGLKYLRNVSILHRDLKPENILSDLNFNIKICDFGLARPGINEPTFTDVSQDILNRKQQSVNSSQKPNSQSLTPQPSQLKKAKQMTCHVVSRWYRAPQLILMQTRYDSSIEMWSVGCILGELISEHENNKKAQVLLRKRKPLFEGKACFPLSPPKHNDMNSYKVNNGFPHSQDDQISKILQVIGSPSAEEVTFIQEQLASNYIKSLPKYEKKKASDIFNYCLPEWEDFLDKTLLFDPRKRMTIEQAISHPLFDGIRDQKDYDFKVQHNLDIVLPSDMSMEQIKAKLNEQILLYKQGMSYKKEEIPKQDTNKKGNKFQETTDSSNKSKSKNEEIIKPLQTKRSKSKNDEVIKPLQANKSTKKQ